MILFHQ